MHNSRALSEAAEFIFKLVIGDGTVHGIARHACWLFREEEALGSEGAREHHVWVCCGRHKVRWDEGLWNREWVLGMAEHWLYRS